MERRKERNDRTEAEGKSKVNEWNKIEGNKRKGVTK